MNSVSSEDTYFHDMDEYDSDVGASASMLGSRVSTEPGSASGRRGRGSHRNHDVQGKKLEREYNNQVKDNSFFGNDFEVMPILNELYDVLREVILEGFSGIHLPVLVAIGDQSQGKTSVLEAIVKKQFLPKGDQIQTRCPIEIQMVHISRDVDAVGHAEILDEDDKKWTFLRDMEQVQKAIQERTNNIKETCTAGISEKRIVVKLYSPDVPDLTLIDMPGFLNVCVAGQTDEITTKIKSVVRNEIKNPNSIILAVTAAGNNIGTSTALKEALRADPGRTRTLGVITKLDLMDKGTTCEAVLRGDEYKLKLGFIGVVCRNFQDNKDRKTIEEKIREERLFFEENYPAIANRNGIPHLTKTISQILLHHIYDTLPGVRVNIEKLIQAYQARYDAFGTVVEPEERRKMLVGYLEKFRDSFIGQIDGIKRKIPIDKVPASAKIQKIYRNLLKNSSYNIMSGITDDQIDKCIKASMALQNMSYLSLDDAFQEFARKEIAKLRPAIIECAQEVNSIMVSAIKASCSPEAERYPKLNNFIAWVATDVIDDCYQKCKRYLECFMDAEEAFVYSSYDSFAQDLKKEDAKASGTESVVSATSNPIENPNPDEFDVSDPIFVNGRGEVRKMVRNYFEIVKRRVMDHCPKAITNMLVYKVIEMIGEELSFRLNTDETAEELMKESVIVQRDREAIKERLEKFKKAKEIINKVLKNVSV